MANQDADQQSRKLTQSSEQLEFTVREVSFFSVHVLWLVSAWLILGKSPGAVSEVLSPWVGLGRIFFKVECTHPICISNNPHSVYCIIFFSSVFGQCCVVWTYALVSNMAVGPLVKENVCFVCLTYYDSPRFRKASQESEEKLCLLPMLRYFSRYRDSKGIQWSRCVWATAKCLLKEGCSQCNCWQLMKRREEKLGANVQSQLPLPSTTGDAWGSVLTWASWALYQLEVAGLFLCLAERSISWAAPLQGQS